MTDPDLHPNVQAARAAGVNQYYARFLDTRIPPDPLDWVDYEVSEARSRRRILEGVPRDGLPDEVVEMIRQAIFEYENIGGLRACLMASANQSVSIDEVLDAFAILLRKATGYADDLVVEWVGDTRPDLTNTRNSLVWYRWIEEDPDVESGAGRHGFKTDVTMEVNLTTRDVSDQAHRDVRINRRHIAVRYLLINAIKGQMLFDDYSDRVGTQPPMPPQGDGITVNVLSIGTMTIAKLPKPDRSRSEQGYIESRIAVTIPVVLKVTIDDLDALAG